MGEKEILCLFVSKAFGDQTGDRLSCEKELTLVYLSLLASKPNAAA